MQLAPVPDCSGLLQRLTRWYVMVLDEQVAPPFPEQDFHGSQSLQPPSTVWKVQF